MNIELKEKINKIDNILQSYPKEVQDQFAPMHSEILKVSEGNTDSGIDSVFSELLDLWVVLLSGKNEDADKALSRMKSLRDRMFILREKERELSKIEENCTKHIGDLSDLFGKKIQECYVTSKLDALESEYNLKVKLTKRYRDQKKQEVIDKYSNHF